MVVGIILVSGCCDIDTNIWGCQIRGRPFVYWTLDALCSTKKIDQIIVLSNRDDVTELVSSYAGAKVTVFCGIKSIKSEGDSVENLLYEVISKSDLSPNDVIVNLHPSFPLIQKDHVRGALDLFLEEHSDSLVSVALQKRFIWNVDGELRDYHVDKRPPLLDLDGYLVESGVINIFYAGGFLKNKRMVQGIVSLFEMPGRSLSTLDELTEKNSINFFPFDEGESDNKKISEIKLFVSDIDGTLTDGGMYYSGSGELMKRFNTKDGKGFELLRANGIKTCLITSEETEITISRANKMKIDFVYQGATGVGKKDALTELCTKLGISPLNVAYIGDDLNCIEALQYSGAKACPMDAVPQVKKVSGIYVCNASGGNGAVREFADKVIASSQGVVNSGK